MWGRLIPKSDRKKIHEYLFRGKLLSSPLLLPNCGLWLNWEQYPDVLEWIGLGGDGLRKGGWV